MKTLNRRILIILVTSIIITSACKKQSDHNFTSADPLKDGYVPDAATAIKIAEAIWLPLFGNDIYAKKPFHAELKNDSIWIVAGSLAPDEMGGVPYAEIQKRDCRILRVVHTK